MEPDRYQQSHPLYVFGMISLLISLGSLLFSIFILPHLLLGWHYDVPEFISFWREWLIETYGVSIDHASWIIAAFFVALALVFGIAAYFASTRIENAIYPKQTKVVQDEQIEKTRSVKGSPHFFWKVMGFIILAYIATFAFQWLISVPPFKELL